MHTSSSTTEKASIAAEAMRVSVSESSKQPKSGLPVYLLFGSDKLIGSFGTFNDAIQYGRGNLIIESGLNVCPQPFHRAFVTVAYANGSPFWTETTVEAGMKSALGYLLQTAMETVEPRQATQWKSTFTQPINS